VHAHTRKLRVATMMALAERHRCRGLQRRASGSLWYNTVFFWLITCTVNGHSTKCVSPVCSFFKATFGFIEVFIKSGF
jgi:predicted GNAT superfamily acetyltransferase